MKKATSHLEARINARNRCHQAANQLAVDLEKIFRPYLGKKILKKDESLLAAIHKEIDELLSSKPYHGLYVYHERSPYTLGWSVKACEDYDGMATYESCYIYVGNIQAVSGVLFALRSTEDRVKLRTDYTVEEIERKRRILAEKEEELRKARSALHPFN